MQSKINILNNKSLEKSPRLHAFDALRATLAIFGIILHAYYFHLLFTTHSISYNMAASKIHGVGEIFFTYLSLWIHSFRMPAFFAISGFFSYYLFSKIGLKKAAFNRVKRILIPFLVLWLGGLALIIFELWHSHQPIHLNNQTLTNVSIYWFLYFLLIFDGIFFLVLKLPLPVLSTLTRNASHFGLSLKERGLIFLVFSLLLGFCSQTWFPSTSITLIPDFNILAYYGLFFAFGIFIAKHYSDIASKYQKLWPLGLIFALVINTIYFLIFANFHESAAAKLIGEFLWTLETWITLFSLFFLFQSIASKPNKIWRYLADSSYWIYIAQVPILLILSLIFFEEKLSLFIAIPSVSLISLAILLISYQLLIRNRRYINFIDGADGQTKKTKTLLEERFGERV